MKISCPKCPAAYELDESRIPPAGLSIKCPKCQTPFSVQKPKLADGPVPLPASKGAPAKPPVFPTKPGAQQGPVPLPASKGAPAAPRPAPTSVPPPPVPGAAVPLPGQARARAAAAAPVAITTPVPGGPAVPLPGKQGAAARAPAAPAPAAADPFADLSFESTNVDVAPPIPPAPAAPPKAAAGAAEDDPFGLDLPAAAAPPPAPAPTAGPLLPDDGGLSFDFVEPPKPAPAPPPPSPAASPELLDFVDDDAPKAAPAPEPRPAPPPPAPVSSRPPGQRPPPPVIAPSSTPPVMTPGAGKAGEDEKVPKYVKPKKPSEPLGPKIAAALRPVREALVDNAKVVGLAAAGVVVLAVVGLGVRAGSTGAGYFWVHKLMPKSVATSSGKKALVEAQEKMREGSFLASRGALGIAAQVLGHAADDDDVRSFFVTAASELKFMYGQGGADWDLAQRTVEKIKSDKMAAVRARAAHALASGDAAKAKGLLKPFVDRGAAEAQGVFVYSQALVKLRDLKGAAAALDAALKDPKAPPKLLLARAQVERQQGQLAEASAFFERVLLQKATHGRALVELADLRRQQGNQAAAAELVERVLQPEAKKSLDASEEAKALLLRAQLFTAARKHKEAEEAFERAVELDPQSTEVRGIYGAWRAGRHEYERALKHLEVALANDPSNPAVLNAAVRALIGVGRSLDAAKRVSEGLRRSPDDPVLLFLDGKVSEQFGKADEAFARYEKALQKKPDHAEALVASGFHLLNKEDKAGARKRLEAAVASPDGVATDQVQLSIGDLWLALGEPNKAKDAYTKALAIDPDDPAGHASMGRALSALGDFAAARGELETALKSLSNEATLQYEYGSLLRKLGDQKGALEALKKAVKISGNDHRFRARLGALSFEMGDLAGAEHELRQAALMSERWSETYFFLGRTFSALKRLPEAIENHRRAIELEPGVAEFHLHLGLTYEMTQQIGDAIKAFNNAAERDPKLAGAHEHVGKNYMMQNLYEDAIKAFTRAVAIDPSRADYLALLADAEQQAGQIDVAIEHYRKALTKNPRLHGAWSRLGTAYKDKACKECRGLAVQAFLRAEQVDPTDPQARRELGYVYKEDGKRAQAIAQFKKYLELKPDAPDSEQVKDDIYYLQEEKKRSP